MNKKYYNLGRLPIVLKSCCSALPLALRWTEIFIQLSSFLLPVHIMKALISAFLFWRTWIDHIHYAIFFSFGFAASTDWRIHIKVLFFSSYYLLVYDQNQWGLKLSTTIYKMQLLYTTHSKTPVVYMLGHNLCHLPPEWYWSSWLNVLQKDPWV